MTITPAQADKWAQRATDGPWMLNPHGCILVDDGTDDPPGPHGFIGTMYRNDPDDTANGELMAAAPELAQTIAGMTEEWGVDADGNALFPVNEEGHPMGSYFTPDRTEAEGVRDRMAKLTPHVRYRLVRRLVGPVEVTE